MRSMYRLPKARCSLLALGFVLAASVTPALAASGADYDSVFSWAERAYPDVLPSSGATTGSAEGYYYRHYPQTGNYLGMKDDGVYFYAPGMSNIIEVGAVPNLLNVIRSCDFTRTMDSASSVFSGRLEASFEDTSGVSSAKGVKQRYLLRNLSSAPVYLMVDVNVDVGRVMLMSPQPGSLYLEPGEEFQGLLVYEAASDTAAGTLSYNLSFDLSEYSTSTGRPTGINQTLTRPVSFTLLAASNPQQPSPASGALSYERVASVTTKVGFWRAATDRAQSMIVLFPGQENWSDGSLAATSSVIYAYQLDGTPLWQKALDSETWGNDVSADGNYIAYATMRAAGINNELVMLDGASGAELWKLTLTTSVFPRPAGAKLPGTGSGHDVREVRFSPSGELVAVGTIGGLVFVVDRETGQVTRSFETFGQVRGLTFSADGAALFAGAGDGYLYRYDLATATQRWKAAAIAWPYSPAALAPHGNWIASGAKSGEVVVVDTNSGACLVADDLGIMTVRKALFSPDGSTLFAASGTPAGSRVYGTGDWRTLFSSVMSADVSVTADSRYVLLADGPTAYLLDARSGQTVATLDTGFASTANYFKVVFVSDDGAHAVIARRDTTPDAVNIAFFRRR